MNSILQSVLAATVSFFIITLFLAFIIIICRVTNHRRFKIQSVPNPETNLTTITTSESATFDPSLTRISMAELIIATKNFSPDLIIGDGSFGLVYKANLHHAGGVTVAIKKLDHDAFQGFREFQAEMETLSKLKHENIVTILGYCATGQDRVLIYEYMENGSVDQWLHDTSASGNMRTPLSWEARLDVVKGVANGLSYLHGLQTPVIHRDIKSSNVLLDKDFTAHISDFGLARCCNTSHSHVSTQVAGTMGYMPPEYREGNTAATMVADVYSFGILMVEVAVQRRPNWPVVFDGKEVGFVQWARKMVEENREMEMVQNVDNVSEENVKEYFRLALLCANETSARPAISEVAQLLNQFSM
jgi:serine/threonine protein kinase